MRSDIPTDVNYPNFVVRETTQLSGEYFEGVGVVHVGCKQVFVNEAQPTTLTENATMIKEQHQGENGFLNCTLNTGTGASLAVALEGASGDK